MRLLETLACLVVLLTLTIAGAAETAPSLKGVVLDDSGAAVPGAKVRLLDGGGERVGDTVSDESGQFALAIETNKGYVLSVKAKGFEETRLKIKPGHSLNGTLRVLLDVAEVRDRVTVTASAGVSAPSANDNVSALSMDEGFLRDLPLKGGDILEIAPLFTDPGATGSAGPQLVVDGVETDALDLPESSIKEVITNHSPFSAEFARPGKGRIEIITKKGSHHHLRGSASTLVRNSALNARNTFATVNPPHQRAASEAELDGPLARRLAFTLAARHEFNNDHAFVNAQTPDGLLAQNVRVPDHFLHLFGRLDYRTTPLHKTFLTFKYKNKLREGQGAGGIDLAERAHSLFDHENEIKLLDTATPAAAWLNQFSFTFRKVRADRSSFSDRPALLVLGAVDFGGAQVATRQAQTATHLEDSASLVRGKHTLRFGGGARLRFVEAADASNFGGTFSFSTLEDFAAGRPFLFTRNTGDPRVHYTQHDFYSFFQDEIRVGERLSLSLGLRHEFQSNVGYHRNFAPRVSLAYALGPSTVLRAGGGVFYDRPPLLIRQQSLLFDGSRIRQVVVSNPGYPNAFDDPAGLSFATPSITGMAADMRLPLLAQGSVTLEQRLGSGPNYLSLEYMTLRGVHLFRTRNINAPLPGTLTPINPAFVNIDQFESSGASRGNRLAVSFKTFSRKRFDLIAQYTLSSTMDDTSTLSSLPANNWDLHGEWGRADYDQRHRFNLAGGYHFPWEVRCGAILKFWSGAPYNITTGVDNNGDTVANDRPPGVGRNTGRGPGYVDIDFRLAKEFRINPDGHFKVRFGVDAFNLLNQVSYRTYVGDLSSPFFGHAVQAFPARQFQVGFRTSF